MSLSSKQRLVLGKQRTLVELLAQLELASAPPFGAAKAIVNLAGFTGGIRAHFDPRSPAKLPTP